MPNGKETTAPEKRNVSKAIAKLPATSLGKHGSKRAITIRSSKGDEKFGEISISNSGVQYRDGKGPLRRRSWRSLVKFLSKGKRVG